MHSLKLNFFHRLCIDHENFIPQKICTAQLLVGMAIIVRVHVCMYVCKHMHTLVIRAIKVHVHLVSRLLNYRVEHDIYMYKLGTHAPQTNVLMNP